VADAAVFLNCRRVRQPLPIDEPFSGIGIHSEVAHLECSEVLEEVAALRGRNAKIAEAGFNDHAGSGDLVPFDRDAEPGFGRSPTTHADQEIGPALSAELRVQVGDAASDFFAAGALEAMKVDNDHIVQIGEASIAQNFGTLAHQAPGIDLVKA